MEEVTWLELARLELTPSIMQITVDIGTRIKGPYRQVVQAMKPLYRHRITDAIISSPKAPELRLERLSLYPFDDELAGVLSQEDDSRLKAYVQSLETQE